MILRPFASLARFENQVSAEVTAPVLVRVSLDSRPVQEKVGLKGLPKVSFQVSEIRPAEDLP
jgi:hypothetical protein